MGLNTAVLLAAILAQTEAVPCQFHVWPGLKTGSVYNGWLHGAVANGAVNGNPNYPTVPTDPMGTADQAALLRAARPERLFGRPTDALVVHSDPLDSRVIRKTPGRISAETSGCYAELVVDDVVLRQDPVTGSHLMVLFRYRDFIEGAVPTRTFATWVKSPIRRLPTTGPVDLAAARSDFRTAFTNNIKLFATAANKPLTKKD